MARVVGKEPRKDLAVLKIPGQDFIAAEWGDSESLEVGALLWAMGSPFGLQRTITFGILSGKHRYGMAGDVYQDFLQTDAAVNPGNSGGPLVDARGKVVGINTAILGESYQGVSFAIPSSVARVIYQRIRSTGRMARGWLGVHLGQVDDELAYQDEPGARIEGMARALAREQSPALRAGLQKGDLIVGWNGFRITKPSELIRQVAMTEVGSTAVVELRRGERTLKLTVTVAERPPLR